MSKQASPPAPYQVSGTLNVPHISKAVVDLLLFVPAHKAIGGDSVSAKVLRITAPAIADFLCKLINYIASTHRHSQEREK